MIQIAVVGCGAIGNAHAAAWNKVPGARLAYCVDTDAARAAATAQKHGAQALTRLADLPPEVGVVSMTTQPAAHYPLVRELLAAGKHVFCEKPLTLHHAEGRELGQLAERRGVKLGVGFKMRYEPIFQKARELVPALGRIYQVQTHKVQAFGNQPWLGATGAMFELSVHDFDLIHYLLGTSPRRVVAARASRRLGWAREDGFALQVEYENGAFGALGGLYVEQITWTGRDFSLWIAGENGYLQIDRADRIVLHRDRVEEFRFDPKDAPNAFVMELTDFLASVESGGPEPIGAEAANATTWIVEEAWRLMNQA